MAPALGNWLATALALRKLIWEEYFCTFQHSPYVEWPCSSIYRNTGILEQFPRAWRRAWSLKHFPSFPCCGSYIWSSKEKNKIQNTFFEKNLTHHFISWQMVPMTRIFRSSLRIFCTFLCLLGNKFGNLDPHYFKSDIFELFCVCGKFIWNPYSLKLEFFLLSTVVSNWTFLISFQTNCSH